MISKGESGSAVKKENFQHLIQHIKQTDPMLYEALRKISENITSNTSSIEDISQITGGAGKPAVLQDKCTFGLVKTLTVDIGLTLYYITRKAGSFIDFTTKIKTQAPTGSSAILDVLKSVDDGVTWKSIFPSDGKIILPDGKSATVITKRFSIADIAVGNLLRIDCTQIGSVNAGKGIEVVGRWA